MISLASTHRLSKALTSSPMATPMPAIWSSCTFTPYNLAISPSFPLEHNQTNTPPPTQARFLRRQPGRPLLVPTRHRRERRQARRMVQNRLPTHPPPQDPRHRQSCQRIQREHPHLGHHRLLLGRQDYFFARRKIYRVQSCCTNLPSLDRPGRCREGADPHDDVG